jgi:hypothetical protein
VKGEEILVAAVDEVSYASSLEGADKLAGKISQTIKPYITGRESPRYVHTYNKVGKELLRSVTLECLSFDYAYQIEHCGFHAHVLAISL